MSLSYASVPKLTPDNFLEWRFLIDPILLSENVDLTDEVTDPQLNAKGLIILRSTVSLQVQSRIRAIPSAFKTLTFLQQQYGDLDAESSFELTASFLTTRMKEGEAISKYIARLSDLKFRVNAADVIITDDLFKVSIYAGLTPTYKAASRGWNKSAMSASALEARLNDLQVDNRPANETALHVTTPHGSSLNKVRPRCSHCNREGHTVDKCFSLYPQLRRDIKKEKINSSQQVALVVSDVAPISEQVLLDCACSTTCSGDPTIFHNLSPVEGIGMEVGDGHVQPATHRGDVHLNLNNHSIILTDALYVPNFGRKILISLADLTSSSISVNFTNDAAELFSGSTLVCKITESNKVYPLPNSSVIKPVPPSCNIQHERMGHASRNVILKTGLPCPSISTCAGCLKGEHPTHAFSHQPPIIKTKKVLEILHTDLCGPMQHPSLGGSLYVCTAVDDYSRKAWVRFIKKKSDAPSALLEIINEAERQSSSKVLKLKSDGGGEFNSNAFAKILAHRGIIKHVTAPYSHEQNGLAERFNRTIVAKARKMLHHRSHPVSLWAEAINHATLLYNSMWHSTTNCPPDTKWNGRPISYSKFKVWGCLAWVRVPKENRQKLDPQSAAMIHVGHCELRGGYKLFNPITNKFIFSRDVVFEELKTVPPSTTLDRSDDVCCSIPTTSTQPRTLDNPTPVEDQVEETDSPDKTESASSSEEELELGNDDPSGEDILGDQSNLDVGDSDDDSNTRITTHREFQTIADGAELPERRRSEPKRLTLVATQKKTPPLTVEDALSGNDCDKWRIAMQDEMDSMKENEVFDLVPLPSNAKPIKSKWVFSYKLDTEGSVVSHKARWVAKGFSQRPSIDYDSVFSPVVRQESIRILLTIGCHQDLNMRHVDIKTAFLHGDIDKDIYVSQPSGYDDHTGRVCKLKRSLYGLKQSPRLWNNKLKDFLHSCGLEGSNADPCVFSNNSGLIIGVYVDDLLILSDSISQIDELVTRMNSVFKTKDLGEPSKLLGMSLVRNRANKRLSLSQLVLIQDILDLNNMQNCKGAKEPLDHSQVLSISSHSEKVDESVVRRFRETIGKLNYLAQCTRPDLSVAVSILSRFFNNPGPEHLTALNHTLRYLSGTKNLVFNICPASSELIGYSDADWGRNVDTRKSVSGYCFLMGGSLVSWKSKGQPSVALSTMEAEYMALAYTSQELLWIRQLLRDLGQDPVDATTIHEDNQSCIHFANDPCYHGRAKHVDIKFNFVRDLIQKQTIRVVYCPTEAMVADMFTKPLTATKLANARIAVNLLPAVLGEC
jgi:hypothetical protein